MYEWERLLTMWMAALKCLDVTNLSEGQLKLVEKQLRIIHGREDIWWTHVDNIKHDQELLSRVCAFMLKMDNINKGIDNLLE